MSDSAISCGDDSGRREEAVHNSGGLALITIVTPATAFPALVHGTSTQLRALGEDLLGESLLRYTWIVISSPPESSVTFSENACNTAKNTTATLSHPGRYGFACSITNELFGIVSTVEVLVEDVAGQLAA